MRLEKCEEQSHPPFKKKKNPFGCEITYMKKYLEILLKKKQFPLGLVLKQRVAKVISTSKNWIVTFPNRTNYQSYIKVNGNSK